MPTPFSSTFASAAASSNGDNSTNRRDGAGGGEWSRTRPNGATQTFRRTSHANTSSQSRDNQQPTASSTSSGAYIPPHLNSNNQSTIYRNGASGESRYSRDQMLDIFQSQKESGSLDRNIEDLFLGSWNPVMPKDTTSQASRSDGKDQYPGPEVCWTYGVDSEPLGLVDMSEEEKQLFTSSVNSPIKLTSANPKDSSGGGVIGGRKPSLSGYSATPGNASRPNTRRRETGDSFSAPGPLSPTESKSFFRNEPNTATPPPALLRRRTDFKEDEASLDQREEDQGPDEESESQTPFSSLRRSTTGPLSAGLNPPSGSPWSAAPQPSAFGSMGSFGSFAVGSSTNPDTAEKRPGFGSARGGSRFKDLLSQTSAEDISAGKDKASFGALEKLPEEESGSAQSRLRDMFKTRPNRSETNPYDDGTARTRGSAQSSQLEGNVPASGIEHVGFSAFAPTQGAGARDFAHGESSFNQTPQGRFNLHEPMSPTNTNPYQSPQNNQTEDDDPESGDAVSQPSGLPPFGSNRRMFSAADEKGGPAPSAPPATQRISGGFGGFGNLAGGPTWSSANLGSGTPGRERPMASAGFGDPIFSPFADGQPPGGAIGSGFFGSGGFGTAGRSSRLGAMFPPAMQDQMRGDSRNEMQGGPFESRPDSAQQSAGVRDPFDPGRRRDDAFGRASSGFDEAVGGRGIDEASTGFGQPGPIGAAANSQQPGSIAAPGQRASTGTESGQPSHGLSQSSGSSSSNQMPAAQQRQMVMPDRMRWIYRDPQGNTQGPWSGLEMHDWFKAGFFTAELQVKKLEDTEYEPLAQLVRRIGNSREPFLVPQIGVPHGPPASNQGNHWASPTIPGAAPQAGNAQPPFASAFPSFGTTLTAEQQNALERRKQEEQFLMARQKEHLAQQQVYMKQMQMHNGPHGIHSLQHHSSAQSLHSQPSFGSIAAPNGGYQPSPMQGPIQPPQAMGPPPTSNAPHPAVGRDDELTNIMDRLTFSQRAGLPYGGGPLITPGDTNAPSSQAVGNMLQDRARLQQHQQQADIRAHQDTFLGPQGRNDRLEEFNELRGQTEAQLGRPGPEQTLPRPIGAQRAPEDQSARGHRQPAPIGHIAAIQKPAPASIEPEQLSLLQQVQRTAAANQQAAENEWSKREDQPVIPPPVSISPLPAPAAQRNRLHVADALAAESRSETQTPVEMPPTSIAPWAERNAEVSKGPSLKEIQELEAKRAAEQERLLAAARLAQAEQERLTQAHAPPPAPGLPSTSTWGTSTSPATPPTSATSVWSKPTNGKPTTSTNGTAKKTLAQIQKEEESRKQRAAAAAAAAAATASAQAASSPAQTVAGKRYAELASKIVASQPAMVSSAWTTVGSSGKAKTPATVIATAPAAARTVSTSSTTSAKPRPTLQPSRSTNLANQNKATEEFTKWTKAQLGKGLNSSINLDSFVQDLMMLPVETDIISDSVYASSQTLDGRRFAEEFVRRRKLADKGIVEPAAVNLSPMGPGVGGDGKGSAGGGWSEVAKKGPGAAGGGKEGGKQDDGGVAAAFKVVAGKKKGKR